MKSDHELLRHNFNFLIEMLRGMTTGECPGCKASDAIEVHLDDGPMRLLRGAECHRCGWRLTRPMLERLIP